MNSRLRKKSVPLAAVGAVALISAGLWAIQGGAGSQSSAARAAGSDRSVAQPNKVVLAPTAGRAAAAKAVSATSSSAAATNAARGSRKPDAPLAGTFTLWAPTPLADPCTPQTAAPDIHDGAAVSVHTVTGAVIATTVLGSGRSEATHRGCVYRFAFTPLPLDPSFSVTVGSRSGLVYTAAQVAAASGHITLNLGLPQ